MFQETRNVRSILWGQGINKFPIEQIIGSNSGIRVHTSNATTREGLIELALCIRPDVVVFDTTLAGEKSWSELIPALRERVSGLGFVAIVSEQDQNTIRELAAAQVDGILQADKVHLELPHGVRAYQRNEAFFNPRFAKIVCAALTMQPVTAQAQTQSIVQDRGLLPTLTNREMEVLACLARGLNYKQIAEKLFVSNSTVKTHVNNIFTKLNINDRTQAVLYALKHGIDQMTPELFSDEATSTPAEAPSASIQNIAYDQNQHTPLYGSNNII